ncbi:LysM peptidoglycan-binding domain-containing protein [Bdellovibrio sp. KM01]|uniref:LysM peptidoglycan-binding domain-containing protein n=1 Tax=Bdellovibrio sp. KM01 TaxID=2748865 RepID=UPI0015E9A212|nr:LysM peptidoglycan-binding domain-containing protein [Bdellovibrio sp. KM01]QLY24963.1 LysM peptidoglycan-binding domain-containing protein [Bdellovibrio sp. KM01]
MKSIERLLFTMIFLMSSVTTAQEGTSYRQYIVQPGDTLSNIADRVRGGHTYGKDENLARLLSLNPSLKDHHSIFVGQTILVPIRDLRSVASEESLAASVAVATVTVASSPTAAVVAQTPAPNPVNSPASTPAKSLAPVPPAVNSMNDDEEEVSHRFEVKAGYQISTLSAEDNVTHSKADLNTDHDLTASIGWSQQWMDRFKTLLSFSLRNLEFQPSTNASKTIINDSKTLYGLNFGGDFLLTDKIAVGLTAGYGQELYLHGLTTTSVSIDTANVSSIGASLDYQIFKKKSTSVGFFVSGSYLGGTSTDTYTIDSGSFYKGLLYIRRDKNGRLLSFEVGAQQRNQNTSVSDLSETNVFGNVIYGFDLFNEEKK